ncbi:MULTISPECIES: 50S ribosomal protein L25/general stress protein Ctc [unclassified Luteimonas]|uniref:50S ribosomal protein L25/general stress protein Ctc n=1 Tax=unclassified Luteimonas TaxID=2629088 RepID=UPI0018F0D358|nr:MULTISPECIES: 50S ribosomal protein L25/general stress protein Ctc [unclassified Luteimonas]MBJ6980075.1 50S ribosomal protein L25/general stress protein Ctc [Luteimonas sp. MC1895]MBJ6985447.1 50S ribosomal protein L25/general stress protein Ctc [Luteimonas sp. MC1750]QQO05300.1 50S ribosomal protein L25/general stress protein Ctc [Luteimonas sp. MC1750]
MSNQKITATSRKDEGKGASRRLRLTGKVPAIIYGGDSAPQSIQLDQEKTWVASQHEWFYASIIDLEVDGKVEPVLLRDMQRHPYRQLIMHLDFQRVNAKEAIRVSVPLHLVNAETSPAGKTAGVVLTQELNEVEVVCLPGDLPESIEVDLAKMEIGGTVHLSEVVLPKGVELATKLDGDHNPAVAVARHARVEAEPEGEGEGDGEVPTSKQDAGEDK